MVTRLLHPSPGAVHQEWTRSRLKWPSLKMSASNATAVMLAVQEARELGRRLLGSLEDDEVRLRALRQLLAD